MKPVHGVPYYQRKHLLTDLGGLMSPHDDMTHWRKSIRLKGFNYSNTHHSYFITICAYHRKPHLIQSDVSASIKASIEEARALHALIHCYCIMPDHLHLLMSLYTCGHSLSNMIRGLKWRVSKQFSFPVWQSRFRDDILRPEDDPTEVCRYILENPIRAGLAETFGEWPHAAMLDPL